MFAAAHMTCDTARFSVAIAVAGFIMQRVILRRRAARDIDEDWRGAAPRGANATIFC